MLQRNDRNYTALLPTLVPPVEVHPGGTIDHPVLIAGFTPVAAEEPFDILPVDEVAPLEAGPVVIDGLGDDIS